MDENTAVNADLHLRRVLETLVDSIEDKTDFSTDHLLSIPQGNFLASELKAIHDDSGSVFPQSVYSNMMSRRNRWRSVYDSEFYPRTPEVYEKWRSENFIDNKRQSLCKKPWSAPTFMQDRQLTYPESTDKKMFSNWKIPSRITDELPSSRQVPNIGDKESPLTPKRTEEQYARINNSHFLPSSLGKPIDSKRSTNETFRHSKSLRTQQLMKTFKDGPNFTTLDSFLKTANKREKDILEKTMRLIYSKDAGTDDAIKNIEKWLSKASSADRHVAINFFETLGVKMMANSSTEEKDTVKKILSLIRNYHSSDEFSIPRSKTLSHISTTPKYIRLLTPSTRENKWLHQTWHHLPSYHDDNPVFNRSAVYTESGKVPYRHWNIHPDWQLQSQFQQY